LGIPTSQSSHPLQKRFARPLYQINYFANSRDEGKRGFPGRSSGQESCCSLTFATLLRP